MESKVQVGRLGNEKPGGGSMEQGKGDRRDRREGQGSMHKQGIVPSCELGVGQGTIKQPMAGPIF